MIFKKVLSFTVLAFLLSVNSYSQTKVAVRGRVIDAAEKEPLIGAQVITNSGIGTVTDTKGNFTLELPRGKHQLKVSYLGYLPETLTINTDKPGLGIIELEVNPTSLDEIIVSATSLNFKNDVKGSNFLLSPKLDFRIMQHELIYAENARVKV
jgi:hypothetical protein